MSELSCAVWSIFFFPWSLRLNNFNGSLFFVCVLLTELTVSNRHENLPLMGLDLWSISVFFLIDFSSRVLVLLQPGLITLQASWNSPYHHHLSILDPVFSGLISPLSLFSSLFCWTMSFSKLLEKSYKIDIIFVNLPLCEPLLD